MYRLLLVVLISGCALDKSMNQSGPSGGTEILNKPQGNVVLMIGDSVTHGYQYALSQKLKDRYEVNVPDDNCRNSWYTTMNLYSWLVESFDKSQKAPSIFVWNNGLWDAMNQTDDGTHGTTDEQYETNIRYTAEYLKQSGARIIFTLTTEIPQGAAAVGFLPGRENQLNDIARRVLPEYGIEIHDLNAVSHGINHLRVAPDDVHFNSLGSEALAESVAGIIK
jgi:lysophospholipase L1-like esterase